MRAAVVIGDCSVDEALTAVRAQPSMEGRALAAEVSAREPYVAAEARPCPHRGRRLRLQALDRPPARRGRARP